MDARQIIAEITRRAVPAEADVPLNSLAGWDSLKGVQLVLKIEQKIGRQLTEAELEKLRSVADVDLLLRSGN